MKWITNITNKIKHTIRSWLHIQPFSPFAIQIQSFMDFELQAIRNRIWYRGDSNELEQLYSQYVESADRYKFWTCKSSKGMEMRKIHTGLPKFITNILTNIVMTDVNDFEFGLGKHKEIWEHTEKENQFEDILQEAIRDAIVVGDGAFKISIDTNISPYPIIEWFGGEYIEYVYQRGRLQEIVFKTALQDGFVLCEHYGKGYITNKLYKHETEIDIKTNPQTSHLNDYIFDDSVILAIPFYIQKSSKYKYRGGSLFDGKLDSFDAFDEVVSQWMDALRSGRAKTYIPEVYIPKNAETGEMLKPNPFDNRYIATDSDMGENSHNTINTEQPNIPHDSYLSTYSTVLDLCLQGIISPSTLGIDIKKLDNSEAQREKEKVTLYTRDSIIKAIQDKIPQVVQVCINAFYILNRQPIENIQVNITFGEYANPSFESQIETVGKGKTQGIMSIEACVEELYGDSKEDDWKEEEIKRLKTEQGILTLEEPSVNTELGTFSISEN